MDINIKKCIINTKNGQLKDVLNILNEKSNLLSTEEALKIIILLCNASVNEKCRVQFTPNDVSDLLLRCLKEIKSLDSNAMNSFLASVYYIIKYFLEMDYYKFTISLENNLIPILHNNIRNNELTKLCRSIYKVIYNYIVSKDTDIEPQDLSHLCIFSVKILYQIKKLDELIQDEVSEYFKSFNFKQIHLESQRDIYLSIITLVEKEIDDKTAITYFQYTMNLLNILIQNHFKEDKFDEGKYMVFKTTGLFKEVKNFKNMSIIMEDIVLIICMENDFTLNIETLLSKIQDYFKQIYKEKKVLQSTSHFSKFLHVVLYTAMQNFRMYSKQFWSNFNEESQIALGKFIAHLSVALSWIKSKCRICENCKLDRDITSAVWVSLIPAYILKYWLSNGNYNSNCKTRTIIENVLSQVKNCLDLCCASIKELQQLNCNNWKTMWVDVGTLIYNLSVILYRNKDAQARLYTQYFIKKLIYFEGVKQSVLKENILNLALLNLSETYVNAKDYKNAMLISAFNVFLHPQNRKSPFWQWVRIKSNERENTNLQNYNLVSIMIEHENHLIDLHPDFKLPVDERKDLLLFELRQYKEIWPSKVSTLCAIKEIQQFNDVFTTVKGIVLSWGDIDNNMQCELYDMVFEVVLEFENIVQSGNNIENNLLMAFLYLIQYYVASRKLQQKNKQDMKDTQIEIVPDQGNNDKNDECDLVSSYESLKIDVHTQTMRYLKKSLNTFKNQIHEDYSKELKEMNVYVTLVKVANEFLVQSYSLEYIQVWLLCYHLGKILNDNVCIVESIGNLIEVSDLNSNFIKDALGEAQNLILQVNNDETYKQGEDAIRKWIVLTNYHISLGLAHLGCGDVESALAAYQSAKEYFCSQDNSKKCDLLRTKFEFFEWRLQSLPCLYKVENHTSVLSKPHFLIEAISKCYKTDGNSAYVLCLLFQIFCSLLHMYRWLRQPREVRCYGREILIVAQELVIPLKCVQILSYLADADLLSMRLNDCRVKVNGICDILGHSKDKLTTIYSTEVIKKSIPANVDVNSITNSLQEMMLDFPSSRPEYEQLSPGSPLLVRDSFKVPSFVQHDNLCDCLYCLSVDYQDFLMVRINLQANMCYCEKNLEASRQYYEGAQCIYRVLLEREVFFRKKVKNILNIEVIPKLENTFRETHCIGLLGLGNTLIRDEKFFDISENLIGILKKNPFFNYHLYNEAILQKYNYLSLKLCNVKKANDNKNVFLSPLCDPIVEIATTPESKCSKVTLTTSFSPVVEPKKRATKLIKFDITENNDKGKNIKVPLSPVRTLSKTPRIPASKLKVYHPASVKSTRKKKVAEPLEFPWEKSENFRNEDVSIEPPKSSKKVEARLKTRTKLLTDKLKNVPTAPIIVVSNESEGGCTKPCDSRPRTRARKNLMTEMKSECENKDNNFTSCASSTKSSSSVSSNGNKGAVKKGTRSKNVL